MKTVLAFDGLGSRIAALGLAQIINWGVLYYTLALIGPLVIAETGWSEAFVYSGFAVATILTGLYGPFAGRSVDRLGGLPVMLVGTSISAIGVLILGFSSNATTYLIAWAIMGIGMSACLYDSSFAALAQMAGPMTRRAISGLTLVAGFSSTVTWPLTSLLLAVTDWRGVCFADAAAMIGVATPLIGFALRSTQRQTTDPASNVLADRETRTRPAPALVSRDRAIPAMILFALIFTAQGFVVNAMSIHVLSLFTALGMGGAAAMLAGTLIGPAQVAARLIELIFGKNLSAIRLGLITMGLFPIALLVPLICPPSIATALCFGIVYGASAGLSTIARGVMPYELFGAEGYGRRLGLLSSPTLLAKAFAPAGIAAVMGAFGPEGAFWACVATGAFAFIATIGLAATVKSSR
jgi:MFS family permease